MYMYMYMCMCMYIFLGSWHVAHKGLPAELSSAISPLRSRNGFSAMGNLPETLGISWETRKHVRNMLRFSISFYIYLCF